MEFPVSPVVILSSISLLLIIAGLIEFRAHQAVLSTIPTRIHVNGTRGKSSVTRLIAAGLRAGGYKTFAKTTGTAPRVIDFAGNDRVIHRLRKASIGEQVRLMRFFAKEKPDVVVMECMAVQPQYQWIAEHQMIKSEISVITNVRPDHLEEMGPTMEDITRSLANTIPVNGKLITADHDALSIFESITKRRGSSLECVDENTVTHDDLIRFKYIEHPQNVALALSVCKHMGVDQETALNGMVLVRPDLGALTVMDLVIDEREMTFINGMAANDPVSTLKIWHFIIDRYPSEGDICVFLNTREDRRSRTRQLLQLVMENIKPDRFIIRGNNLESMVDHLVHYSPETKLDIIPMDRPVQDTINAIITLSDDSLIFAIGNQVGMGQDILNKLKTFRHDD